MKEAAVAAYSRRDYAGAVDLLSRAISLDCSNHVFWSNRSAAYMALEKFGNALADADECVRLQPGWAKGHARTIARKHRRSDGHDVCGTTLSCQQPISLP